MKRITALLITGLMLLSLLAGCSGNAGDSAADADFTWTRKGDYQDPNGCYLILTADPENEDSLSATLVLEEKIYGGPVEQAGKTLQGDLDYEDDAEFLVTISEEGEDGLMVETADGEVYHFTPASTSEAAITVDLNTVGMGQIAYASEGETPELNPERPVTSAQLHLEEPATYVLAAKAFEDWKFVKWMKDGEDFATDAEITVEFSEAQVEYVAVFEAE